MPPDSHPKFSSRSRQYIPKCLSVTLPCRDPYDPLVGVVTLGSLPPTRTTPCSPPLRFKFKYHGRSHARRYVRARPLHPAPAPRYHVTRVRCPPHLRCCHLE